MPDFAFAVIAAGFKTLTSHGLFLNQFAEIRRGHEYFSRVWKIEVKLVIDVVWSFG